MNSSRGGTPDGEGPPFEKGKGKSKKKGKGAIGKPAQADDGKKLPPWLNKKK